MIDLNKNQTSQSHLVNNYERIQLAKIDKRMGLKALKEVSCIVKPETILKWF